MAQGTQDVAGQRWVVYGTRPGEPVWIADLTGPDGSALRLVIDGSGTDDDYRTLDAAAQYGDLRHPS